MKQNNIAMKTMAIKARVYNIIRTKLYKQRLDKIPDFAKIQFFNEIFEANLLAHNELTSYKCKRQDKAELLKKRLASPQTKSMKKKLGLIPRKPKINLVDSK